MKRPLEDVLTEADEASGKASEIARNLGLGAIAVIWIFKNPEGAKVFLPNKLLSWALLLAVCSLGIDLSQYIFRSVTLHRFFSQTEKKFDNGKLSADDISDVHTPDYIIKGANLLWWLKISSIFISYILISCFLAGRLS